MVQPIQYQIPGVTDPFTNVVQGLRLGSSLAEMDAARAQRALQQQQLQQQIQQRQLAMEQQQRFQQAQQDLLTKVRNKSAVGADFFQVASMGDKDQAASALSFFKELNAQQQSEMLRDGLETMAALDANPALGVAKMREKAAALRNSGREDEAKRTEDAARIAELNPAGAVAAAGVMLSYLPGGDKALESYTKLQADRRAAALQPEALKKAVADANEAVAKATSAQAAATTAAAREQANLDRANAEARKAEVEARVARTEEQLTGGFRATEQIRNAEFYRKASPKQQEALENIVKLGRSTTEIIMPGEKTGQSELAKAAPTWASQMRDAANITGDVNRYRKLLPKAITGTFADQRAAVARAFGFGAENLAATREVVRGLGRFVLNGRGKLEGQGSISNFEQEVIAKAESGDISLSPAELSTLFDAVERDARLLYQQNRSLFDNTKEAYPEVKIFEVLSKSVPKLPEPVRVEVPAVPARPAAPAPASTRPAAAAPAPVTPAPPPGFGPRAVTGTVTPAQSFPVTPQPGVRTQSLSEIFKRQ